MEIDLDFSSFIWFYNAFIYCVYIYIYHTLHPKPHDTDVPPDPYKGSHEMQWGFPSLNSGKCREKRRKTQLIWNYLQLHQGQCPGPVKALSQCSIEGWWIQLHQTMWHVQQQCHDTQPIRFPQPIDGGAIVRDIHFHEMASTCLQQIQSHAPLGTT